MKNFYTWYSIEDELQKKAHGDQYIFFSNKHFRNEKKQILNDSQYNTILIRKFGGKIKPSIVLTSGPKTAFRNLIGVDLDLCKILNKTLIDFIFELKDPERKNVTYDSNLIDL